jgi:hypothetical protein
VHFRRLVEAGLSSAAAARQIATNGLAALHERMRFVTGDEEIELRDALDKSPSAAPIDTVVVAGEGEPERELVVPYRGQRLRGDAITRQLAAWVDAGVIEPSCAEAVGAVLANPGWLDLSDVTVVAFGAGAEMGPVQSVLRWGGDVVAVDLPRPAIWNRLTEIARRYAGRLRVPARKGASTGRAGRRRSGRRARRARAVARRAGRPAGAGQLRIRRRRHARARRHA